MDLKLVIFFFSLISSNTCSANDQPIFTHLQASHYWSLFKVNHGKSYASRSEENERMKVFTRNLQLIFNHNREESLGLKSFKLGINQFADLTDDEFANKMMVKSSIDSTPDWCQPFPDYLTSQEKINRNGSINWVKEGKVSPVTDQGHCGSCWAFSTIASVESAISIATEKDPMQLSQQELVDCVRGGEYISQGCQGGQMPEGFDYIKRNGISSLESYQYTSGRTENSSGSCLRKNDTGIKPGDIKSCVLLTSGNEEELITALNLQPVSVSIDAGSPFFRFYLSGVYNDLFCYTDQLNHGVVAVGYDESSIIVRNSWGPDWGDSGYIRMKRGRNICGIAEQASFPVAK